MQFLPNKLGIVTILALGISGCADFRNHGYAPSEATLSNLIIGKDTEDTVASLIGRPASDGLIDGNNWYYVESRFRHVAFLAPQEVEREVVVVRFTDGGTLRSLERYGLEDGRVIAISSNETELSAEQRGFLAQLLHDMSRGL